MVVVFVSALTNVSMIYNDIIFVEYEWFFVAAGGHGQKLSKLELFLLRILDVTDEELMHIEATIYFQFSIVFDRSYNQRH